MKLTKLLALGLVVGIAGWWWLGPVVNGPRADADATAAVPVPPPLIRRRWPPRPGRRQRRWPAVRHRQRR